MLKTMNLIVACLTGIPILLGAAEFDSQMKLKAEAPGGAFVDGEPLRFELVNKTPTPGSYSVVNWRGKTVAEGKWVSDTKTLTLPVLPRGHYILKTKNWECPFAVLKDPAKRPDMSKSYFAIDSHFCWSADNNRRNGLEYEKGFDQVATLIQRIGVTVARDRISWNSKINPAPGKYDFGNYPKATEAAKRQNIALMDVFHSCPAWALSDDPRKKGLRARLPDNLFATYDFCKKAAETFRGKVKFWEFWNEQDWHFSGEPAWDYAANMKAAYLGFKSGAPEQPVLSGGFSVNIPNGFFRSALMSDLGQYFDIVNWHTYMPRGDYPKLMTGIRNVMRETGIPASMPIWFSEIGTYVEGNAREPGLRKGLMEHDFAQELAVGREIPKIYLAMQQLGVARTFWYVMMPNNEQGGKKSWGLIRYDRTVKASYTAFSTMTDQLGAAKLLGTMNLGKDVAAYLYRQPDHFQTLVLWTGKDKRSVKIPGTTEKTGAVDFLGSKLALNNGAVELDASPVYVNNLFGLFPDIKAIEPGIPGAIQSDCDKSVVMKLTLPPGLNLKFDRSRIDFPAAPQRITIDLFNFSPEEKRGTITVTNAELNLSQKEITIPAMGKTSIDGMLSVQFRTSENADILFGGKFNGKPITKLAVPAVRLNPYPGYYREKPLSGMMSPEAWRKNSGGNLEINRDTAENALKFTVTFPKNAKRYVQPSYGLNLPATERKGAIGFAVDIKALKTGIIIWDFHFRMLGKNKYFSSGNFFGRPSEEWSTQYYFFSDRDHPEKADRIELKITPAADQYSWLFRNPRLLYPGKR